MDRTAWYALPMLVLGALFLMGVATACGGSADGDDAGGAGDLDSAGWTAHDVATNGDVMGEADSAADGGADGSPATDTGADCLDAERRCGPRGEIQVCTSGAWSPQETCTTGRVCREGQCVAATQGECTPGEVRGCASETAVAVCDDGGFAYEPEECPAGQFCVQGACGDQLCAAASRKCQDLDTFLVCATNGQAWGNPTPCGDGTVCNDGACVSGCEAAIKLSSYIGCEYWTIDLDNYPDPYSRPMPNEVPHSVVISNPSHAPARIRFDTESGVAIPIADDTVPPGEARAFTMPRLDVDGSGLTWNSIRVRSSMPVNAYQFNPLNNEAVYSNDGSLLLPANTLGRKYIVASWPSGVDFRTVPIPGVPQLPAQSGYVTIVATDGGTTQVTVRVSCDTDEGPDVPAMVEGDEVTFDLEQYQVLSIQAKGLDFAELIGAKANDLTGTTINATKPVAVFGGHEEAVIAWDHDNSTGTTTPTQQGSGSCCADHLEEQLLPVQVWRSDIICAKAPPRSDPPEPDIWRIFSGGNANQITTEPLIEGLNGQTLQYGQWIEVQSSASFEVHGTGPVMAVQYVVSQEQTDDVVGDPAMIMAVPVEQFRDDYRILVPDGYSTDWVTVIRKAGDQVLVDDLPTTVSFAPIGVGTWEIGYVPLDAGTHHVTANQSFGLIAFGWDGAVSYGYPAGLNLRAEDWTPVQ